MPKMLRLAQVLLIIQAILSFVVIGYVFIYIVGWKFLATLPASFQALFVSNPFLGILTLLLFVVLVLAPFAQIVCALYLPSHAIWAYRWATILAVVMLFSVPIGTVCGVIILAGLFAGQSRQWFSGVSR